MCLLRCLLRILIVLAASLLLWGCSPQSVTRNNKITVEIEFEGRLLTGTTVWQVTVFEKTELGRQGFPFRFDVRGQAMAIPLSANRALFVLRRGHLSGSSIEFGGYLLACARNLSALARFEGTCELDTPLPEVVLATGDLAGTAVPKLDALESSPLATGRARIVRILAETTNLPVSTGLAAFYPWINNLREPEGDFPPGNPEQGIFSTDKLYKIDFVTE